MFIPPFPNPSDFVCAGIILFCIIISWFYFFRYFRRVKITHHTAGKLPPVSLVIAARNELKNLQKHLPLWLSQNYPEFEVVIADDGSTDGTSAWITPMLENEPRLGYVLLDAEYIKMHGKKLALTLGFKKARYNHFVLTDADCIPAGENWLSEMAAGFGSGAEIVLGYSPYTKSKGILGSMIQWETLLTALHYLGFALAGKPYMGVGRNLAYTRKVYDQAGGFSAHHHLPAGDDDLFVQQAANTKNVAVCISAEAITSSAPKATWREWWRQKKRHMWVGKYYPSAVKRSLAGFPIAQLLFWICIPVWFILGAWWPYPLFFLFVKLIPEWIITAKKARILGIQGFGFSYPVWNLMYTFWYVIAGIASFFTKKPVW
ncbi:MAG: glycosyltransferase [Bacteroidetes bacterium]|nr:glycosyltransferase [Bacteroidota bacterium]